MRVTPVHIVCLISCALCVDARQASAQVPHGTAFTYQGRLNQSGAPFTGSADVIFTLKNNQIGAGSFGSPVVATNLNIVDGQFTVDLDFGSYPLQDQRWLEIAVRVPHDPLDGAAYILLSPRQAITGAPYSINTRGLDVSDTGEISVGGEPSASRLTVYRDPLLSGAAIKGMRDDVDATLFGQPAGIEGYVSVDAPTDGGSATYYAGVMGVSSGGAKHVGVFGKAYPTIQFPVEHRTGVFGTTSDGYGILGHNASDGLAAILGQSFLSSGSGIGVHGTSKSTTSIGVLAEATHFSGVNFAMFADTNSANGYAGYFVGGRNYFEGNVGIGTTEPAYALEVVGSIDADGLIVRNPNNSNASYTLGWLNDVGRIRIGGNGAGASNGFDFQGIGNASLLRITGGGLIGINTTSPGFDLEVNGTAGKPGGGSWAVSSDRRLKKNIEPLEGTLDRLLHVEGVTYEYLDPAAINERSGVQVGVVAQQVETVFPDWVDENSRGHKTVTFRGFEALAIEALRDLRDEKDREIEAITLRQRELESGLAARDERIADLESRLEELSMIIETMAAQQD